MRHAKASWDYPDLSDFERPLTARGRRDAPLMAGVIREQNDPPTLIVSSSALRAVTTARVFAEELAIPLASMLVTNELYEATTRDAMSVIHALDEGVQTVMLVGHNPTWTTLVNFLSDRGIDELPTCGCVKLVFPDAKRWTDIDQKTGQVMLYEYPQRD